MKAKGYADAGGDAAQIAAAGMAVAYAGSALTMADTKLAAAKAAMSADEAATASALTVAEDVLIPKKTSTETFGDSVAISRTTEGRSVTVGSGDTKFSPSADAPQSIAGGFGQLFERSDAEAGTSERVTVYTNVEVPTATPFADVHTADDDSIASVADDGVVTLASSGNDAAQTGLGELMQSDDLPIEGQTFTYIENAADDDLVTTRPLEFSGSFDGAGGSYKCTGTCSIVRAAEGGLNLLGAWTFTPDDGAMVDVADADHLRFGYWMQTTAGDSGNVHDFDVFSGGAMPFDNDDDRTNENTGISALEGTASYAGSAGGLYVRKALDSSGGVTSARHGNFTADAELKASFGGAAVAADDHFSISGTVKNFMDGAKSLSGWSVDLMRADFVTRAENGDLSDHTGGFGDATTGGGEWSGTFFGAVTADDDTTGDVDESETGYPSGVAGEFDAHFSNGHVNGAFGAELQD